MRTLKLATFLLISLFILSCNQNLQSEKNLEMYLQVWDDIMNKGKIDNINDTYFDVNITGISGSAKSVGLVDFKANYQNYLTGFSNIKFTVVDAYIKGDLITKHWNFKGKHTGDFFGIPATGRTVDLSGVTLAKIKEDKITQEEDFLDNNSLLTQLGILSNPNNVTVINNLYNAFAGGEIPKVLEAMDAKVVWNEAEGNAYADGNPYIGPEAVLNGVFARIGAEHEFFSLKDIKLHDMNNNQVLASLRYDAKYKNGTSYNAQVAHLWSLKDGKIIAFQQYADTKKINDALK